MKTRTNAEWLASLKGSGPDQQSALDDLRQYLLHATLYFFSQNRGELRRLAPSEIEQIAQDIAQDALLTILKHLDEFRGESKFTTWAYRFAINIALVEVRRRQYKSLSLDELQSQGETPEWSFEDEKAIDPGRAAQQQEAWSIIREVIQNQLTERQRQILLAVAFEQVPMDEVTRYFDMNRNAVYKMMHDARIKLKKRLEERGFGVDEILQTFELSK